MHGKEMVGLMGAVRPGRAATAVIKTTSLPSCGFPVFLPGTAAGERVLL